MNPADQSPSGILDERDKAKEREKPVEKEKPIEKQPEKAGEGPQEKKKSSIPPKPKTPPPPPRSTRRAEAFQQHSEDSLNYCDVCNVKFLSPSIFASHLNSDLHIKKVICETTEVLEYQKDKGWFIYVALRFLDHQKYRMAFIIKFCNEKCT